jgi:Domain of unknown function (DUF4942)
MTTKQIVQQLKSADQDYEFYPSTQEIIDTITADMVDRSHAPSILDIGAGDGRVLLAVRDAFQKKGSYPRSVELYAIEKSTIHLNNMPKDITVLGTEFREQSLCDKPVKYIFCNPPYSEFEEWMLRIIREGSAEFMYFVVPRRWRDSQEIQQAVDSRRGEVESLGEFDFADADRQARCLVEVIRIEILRSDAFDAVLESMLPELDIFDSKLPEGPTGPTGLIVAGRADVVGDLVSGYNRALQKLLETYRTVLTLDLYLLHELEITKPILLKKIRMKIVGLKKLYWESLFSEMTAIRNRLATKQRRQLLDSLNDKFSIDFTTGNVYAVLLWVTRWANDYFDEQTVELFRSLSQGSCAVRYKSNQRIWTQADWRYSHYRADEAPTHYKLEYRMVLSRGGLSVSQWDWERRQHAGLTQGAFEMLADIVTVGNNLGFRCDAGPKDFQWESNVQNTFYQTNGKPLVAVRAFKNGNMHLHFAPEFMLALNIEAGRLLGWIRNPVDACDELDVPESDRAQVSGMFGSSFKISAEPGCLLLGSAG